jgi:hypothetical protein
MDTTNKGKTLLSYFSHSATSSNAPSAPLLVPPPPPPPPLCSALPSITSTSSSSFDDLTQQQISQLRKLQPYLPTGKLLTEYSDPNSICHQRKRRRQESPAKTNHTSSITLKKRQFKFSVPDSERPICCDKPTKIYKYKNSNGF